MLKLKGNLYILFYNYKKIFQKFIKCTLIGIKM